MKIKIFLNVRFFLCNFDISPSRVLTIFLIFFAIMEEPNKETQRKIMYPLLERVPLQLGDKLYCYSFLHTIVSW